MLVVKINFSSKIAEFSGATFQFRELIKSTGQARGEPKRKIWMVSDFNVSEAELQRIFPEIIIEAIDTPPTNNGVEQKVPTESLGNGAESNAVRDSSPGIAGLPESLSVPEVLVQAERALLMAFPGQLFVRGTIASVNSRNDGSCFLTLAEDETNDQSLSCVIWSSQATRIASVLAEKGFSLEANLAVMLGGNLRLNKRRGEISFVVTTIVPEFTLAKLLAKREQTNQRLKAEGLFDKNKQLQLPMLPQRLGLITSTSGTVIHDFRTALDSARFGFELLWCHAAMQGENAVKEIIAAIKKLQQEKVDAILIFRGGGSASDLAAFNEYALARAVCLCPIPILSAIGHQEDQSSVQDVSYHVEGVPQSLGRFFANRVEEFRRNVRQFSRTIVQHASASGRIWNERLERNQQLLLHVAERVCQEARRDLLKQNAQILRDARLLLALRQRAVEECARLFTALSLRLLRDVSRQLQRFPGELVSRATRGLRYRKERLESLHTIVAGSSPTVQLRRGFALVRSVEDKRYLIKAEQLSSGEQIEIVFADGAKITRIE